MFVTKSKIIVYYKRKILKIRTIIYCGGKNEKKRSVFTINSLYSIGSLFYDNSINGDNNSYLYEYNGWNV